MVTACGVAQDTVRRVAHHLVPALQLPHGRAAGQRPTRAAALLYQQRVPVTSATLAAVMLAVGRSPADFKSALDLYDRLHESAAAAAAITTSPGSSGGVAGDVKLVYLALLELTALHSRLPAAKVVLSRMEQAGVPVCADVNALVSMSAVRSRDLAAARHYLVWVMMFLEARSRKLQLR